MSCRQVARLFFPEQQKALRFFPQGIVRECRIVGWHDHAHDEGTDGVVPPR